MPTSSSLLGSFQTPGVSPAPRILASCLLTRTCPPWTAPGTPLGSGGLVAGGEGQEKEEELSLEGKGRFYTPSLQDHHGDQKAGQGLEGWVPETEAPRPDPVVAKILPFGEKRRELRTREGTEMHNETD